MGGALAHLKVLDLSRVLAGPWASQLLADLGAEVIKVEKPGSGDDTRHWGPPWLADGEGRPTCEAAYYLCTNRNKRSLTVNMTTPEGQALIRELAADADVVLENFKVGGLAPYGLDYTSLRPLNPKLVYCSITGFGQDGPYATRAGYDFLIQGMGGLMSLTGVPEGEPGAGPQKVGVALTDILTGLYAGNAILAALAHRDRDGFRSGEGQHIDLALLDVQVACLGNQALNYLVSGTAPRRMGNAHPNIVPYQDFPTADGDMILAIGNDGQFARFCTIAGHPEWAGDARFADNAARVRHRQRVDPAVAPGDGDTHHRRVDHRARKRRRPLRPDQRPRRGLRRPAGAGAGRAVRAAPSVRRHCPAGGQPDPAVGDAGRLPAGAADAGPGYRRGVARTRP